MKKIFFFAAMAAVAFAGCNKDEGTVPPPAKSEDLAIRFSTAIAEIEQSRGVPLPANTTNFKDDEKIGVYGTETFNTTATEGWMVNAELTRKTRGDVVSWDYATKYFKKGYAYTFVAYAPFESTNQPDMSTPEKVQYSVAKELADQKDFMYAPMVSRAAGDTYEAVKFNFQHALSQVKFAAKTKEAYSDYTITVTSVKISGLYSTGTLDCTDNKCTWTPTGTQDAEYIFPVNNVVLETAEKDLVNTDANQVLMLLPQSVAGKNAVLTLTITPIGDAPAIDPASKEVTVQFPADSKWNGGSGYKYVVTLDMNTILGWSETTFEDPVIADWSWGNDIPLENK